MGSKRKPPTLGDTLDAKRADRITELEAELAALREVRQRGCECSDQDACAFARERDAARAEVELLQAENSRLRLDLAIADKVGECAHWETIDGDIAENLLAELDELRAQRDALDDPGACKRGRDEQ